MIEVLSEKANKLPLLPGVYIMRDAAGQVIYVGKAKKLKNRVSSYFHGQHLPKVQAMVDKVADFEVIVVGSEFEALMLENSLIKRHMPHYNILLRDDKGYPFIRLEGKGAYPRFSVANRKSDDGAKYFGPFGGRSLSYDIIATLQKTLKLPSCSRRFPRDIGKARPCLNYHMGACLGYCLPETDQSEYCRSIAQAELLLSGKTAELKAQLTEEMLKASEELRFEAAAAFRDRLKAVESLENRQKVIATAYADTDVLGFFRGAKTCFAVLHYSDGSLAGKDFEMMDEPLEEDAEAISDILRQYYSRRGNWPKLILLPTDIEDAGSLERLFAQESGHAVRIECPKRGDKAALVASAGVNAREEVARATTASQRRSKTLEWLQKTLELPSLPRRIEAFDISNTGSFGVVAAMTVFSEGKPLKRDYRKFKMKSVDGQDDYGSMYEAVYRRFSHCVQGDEGFEDVPDLLLIDGGDVHAAVAERALAELGLVLPVYGMVKDDHHRTRALVCSDGREIGIQGKQAVFAFIGTIQEETHRFAIEYHRSLRSGTIGSSLDSIPGVGPRRRSELLGHFKTIKAIKSAGYEELCSVVPKNTARAVYDYYHKKESE